MEPIQIIGLKDLRPEEKDIVNKLVNEYYEKLCGQLKNDISLVVHIKDYGKGGRKKYAVRARIKGPVPVFESSAADYDLAKGLHMVFTELGNQAKHKLKTDSQNKPRASLKSERY